MSWETWLPFLGPIVVAAIGAVLGGRYAAKRAAQVDNRRVDLDGYSRLNDALQREIARREAEEERSERQINRLSQRIAQLERDSEQDRERIRRLSADLLKISDWARGLVALLEQAGIDFPPAPIDLSTDPRLRLPRRPPTDRPETD